MGDLNDKKSITRKNLALELAARTDRTANEANSEKGFAIPGLCKLQVVFRKARRGRNPRTGEPILIGARKALKGLSRSEGEGYGHAPPEGACHIVEDNSHSYSRGPRHEIATVGRGLCLVRVPTLRCGG